MKSQKLIVLSIVVFSSFRHLSADVSNSDPNAQQFRYIKSELQNLYTGDLNLDFDLLKIPGRNGLDYAVKLTYAAGIRLEQEATWVGLGFNLSPPVITRNVIHEPDDGNWGWLWGSFIDGMDQDDYFININGMADKLVFETINSVYAQNWRPWKISYHLSPSGIDVWTIITEDGKKYIFNKAVLKNMTTTNWTCYAGGNPCIHADSSIISQHAYMWYCTQILSSDYIDVNANNQPDDADKGSWIKFYYSDYATGLQYNSPKVQVGSTYLTSTPCEPGGRHWAWSKTRSWINFSILDSIVTPTHKAKFTPDLLFRDDAKSVAGSQLKKLASISLFKRGNSNAIKIIGFNYTYDLCKGAPGATSGKLTLTEINEVYKTGFSQPDPEFVYIPSLKFYYDRNYNFNYNPWYFDLWGYYSNTGNTRNWTAHFDTVAQYGGCWVDWPPSYAINTTAATQAWSLKKIVYPSGAFSEYEYEPDSYRYVQLDQLASDIAGGGIRVKAITVNDGMGNLTKTYYYYDVNGDGSGASTGVSTINPSKEKTSSWTSVGIGKHFQQEVHYYQVTVKKGLNRDQGKTVYSFITAKTGNQYCDEDLNYIGIPLTSNAWKRGKIETIKHYNNNGITVKSENYTYNTHDVNPTQKNYHIFIDWIEDYISPYCYMSYPYKIKSGWVELTSKSESFYDELGTSILVNTINYSHNTFNGLDSIKNETNSDNTQRITQTRYAYEEKSKMKSYRNMLNQVYATIIIKGPSNVDSKTWTLWDSTSSDPAWRPRTEWEWIGDGTADDQTAPASPAGSTETICTKTYSKYDIYGNLLGFTDANNVPSAQKWAHKATLPIATVNNAASDETCIDDFEDGRAAWADSSWSGGTVSYRNLATDYVYSGDSSFKLTQSSSSGVISIYCYYIPVTANKKYQIAVAIRGQGIAANQCGTEVKFYTSTKAYLSNNTLINEGGTFNWKIHRHSFTTPTNTAYIRILLRMGNSLNASVWFDGFRAYPAKALCTTQTYDPQTFIISSQSDENSVPKYFQYNFFGDCARIFNSERQIVSEFTDFFASSYSWDHFVSYPPLYFEKVHFPNGNFIKDWSFERTTKYDNAWTIDPDGNYGWDSNYSTQQYVYGGCSAMSFLEGAGRVHWEAWYDIKVDTAKAYQMAVWSKTADGYTGGAGYVLFFHKSNETSAGSVLISVPSGDRDWTKYSYSFKPPASSDHVYAMYLDFQSSGYGGRIYFDGVQFYQADIETSPIFQRDYTDGLNRLIQSQQQEKNGRNIQQLVYDAVGRKAITSKSAWVAGRLLYDNSFIPAGWTIGAAMTNGHLVDYYDANGPGANAQGYPYDRTIFKFDPLERPSKDGSPGLAYIADGSHPFVYNYNLNAAVDYKAFVVNTLLKNETTDENGYKQIQFMDKFGNTVMDRILLNDTGSDTLNTCYFYDTNGNLKKALPPLTNANPNSPYATAYRVNPIGQILKKICPDVDGDRNGNPSNETVDGASVDYEYLYDKNGNLRFMRDANLLSQSKFVYSKYDSLNRVKIEGLYTDPSQFTSTNANNPSWPTTITYWKTKYYYDQDFILDGDNYVIGKAGKIEQNTDSDVDPEMITKFKYDADGNVIEKRVTLEGLSEKSVKYVYDKQGNVYKTIYPSGKAIRYRYDESGKIVQVDVLNN